MVSLLSLFKPLQIDMFAETPHLYFKGRANYQTLLGTLLTYLYISLTLWAIIMSSRDFISRENPNFNISERRYSVDDSPEVNFVPEAMNIGFGVFEENSVIPLDESYFKIELLKMTMKKLAGSFKITSTLLQLKQCPELLNRAFNKGDGSGNKTEINVSNMMFCLSEEVIYSEDPEIKSGSKEKINLNGFLGSNEYSSLYVNFQRCVNTTDEEGPEEIEAKINRLYFGGLYSNTYIDPKNLDSPLQKNLEWFSIKSQSDSKKELRISLQKGILKTDTGTFSEQNDILYFESLSSMTETQSYLEGNYFITFSLQIDKTERTFSRKYKKFQDVAGEVGGWMQIISFAFTFIMKKLANLIYRHDLYNSLLKTTNAVLGTDEKNIAKNSKKPNKIFNLMRQLPFFKMLFSLKNINLAAIELNMDLRSVLNQSIRTDCLINLLFPDEKKDQFEYYYLLEKRKRLMTREHHRSLTFVYDAETKESNMSISRVINLYKKDNLIAINHEDSDLFSKRLDLAITSSLSSLRTSRNKMPQFDSNVFNASKSPFHNNFIALNVGGSLRVNGDKNNYS